MSEDDNVYYYKSENGLYVYGTRKKRPDLLDKILGIKPKEVKKPEVDVSERR